MNNHCSHEFVGPDDRYFPCQRGHDGGLDLHGHFAENYALSWRTGSVFDHVDVDEAEAPPPPVTTRHGVTS